MKWIYKIKLQDGRTMYCNFQSEEQMFAKTESQGLKVIEYWWNQCNKDRYTGENDDG